MFDQDHESSTVSTVAMQSESATRFVASWLHKHAFTTVRLLSGVITLQPLTKRLGTNCVAAQADEDVFSKEAQSSLCFTMNGRAAAKRTTYEEFRRLNAKWQMKLARRFIDCLQSEEYVQTRNALLILNKVVKVRLLNPGELTLAGLILPIGRRHPADAGCGVYSRSLHSMYCAGCLSAALDG